MDYTDALKNLLRPLGFYDLDTGAGADELAAIGGQMNQIYQLLLDAENNICPDASGENALALWSSLLPFVPAARTAQEYQNAVSALLRIDGTSFTVKALNETVIGCGIPAQVEESPIPMMISVSFPGQRGEPDNIDALKVRIEQILPCHLGIDYRFLYTTWTELTAVISLWELASDNYSWREFERVG